MRGQGEGPTTGRDLLLDRDVALATIDGLLEDATDGRGGLLLIEGAPGIGKSSLVRAACRRARGAGLQVYAAQGSELERGHGFGVVRQLFEPLVAAMANGDRHRLATGATRLALPVLEPSPGPAATTPFAALHGLHWLVADLADDAPVLLAVDDAHWVDTPSLEWLAYLQHRLDGLCTAVVVATRVAPVDSFEGRPARLLSRAATAIVRPLPLSVEAVAALAEVILGTEPDPAFASGCHLATAGNPFAVREVLRELAVAGIAPTASAGACLTTRAPPAVARDLLVRLAPLGSPATELARALAMLRPSAELRLVADLARLPPQVASGAADGLVAAGVLLSGRPLRFAHPLLRAAVEEEMPDGVRSRLHERAAALLAAEDADVEAVAAHLMAVEPAGAAEVVSRLRAAAGAALGRGAPAEATGYLRRALDEPPSTDLAPVVLSELGRAELIARHPAAPGHLSDALSRTTDPIARAMLIRDLADASYYQGELQRGTALLRSGLRDLGNRDPEMTLRLETLLLGVAITDLPEPKTCGELERLRRLADTRSPAARGLQLTLAMALALQGAESVEGVITLVDRGLDGGRFLAAETCESISITHATYALIFVDNLDRACRVADEVLADAQGRGSVLGFVTGAAHRGLAHLRAGRLAAAEADLEAALELADQCHMQFTLPFITSYLATTLLDQGRLAEAVATVDRLVLDPEAAMAAAAAVYLHARASVRVAEGRLPEAMADFRSCGELCRATAIRSPTAVAWRSPLAMLVARQDPEEAWQLVSAELEDAYRTGVSSGIGVALRAAGSLAGGDEGLELLRQAVDVLAGSPATLDLARAHLDLGAMLARTGNRLEARKILRVAGDLAYRCGAEAVVAQVRTEALAAGARPRRLAVTGVEALTPSELRVVQLASQGLANREIAQSLFITAKTVKDHLGSAYRKLGISSRTELARSLYDNGVSLPAR
ncbi:MAG: helix-turn-helix transcriptional regulator [Acidimicrobiales bacterium]